MKVLIIDDEADARRTLQLLFRMEKIDSETVGSMADARKALLSGKFDAIVLDLMMPQENGWEFLDWKKTSLCREIPVVVCSGYSDLPLPIDAPCVKAILVKPADNIVGVVKSLCSVSPPALFKRTVVN